MISGLVYGCRAILRSWEALRDMLVKATRHTEFQKIAVQFFTEAAVLVAVFPILDTIIERRAAEPTQGGMRSVTWGLVGWSEGIALACIIVAGIIAINVDVGE